MLILPWLLMILCQGTPLSSGRAAMAYPTCLAEHFPASPAI